MPHTTFGGGDPEASSRLEELGRAAVMQRLSAHKRRVRVLPPAMSSDYRYRALNLTLEETGRHRALCAERG